MKHRDRCSRGVDRRWAPTPRCGMGVKSRAWMTNLMVYVNRRLLGQQRDKLFREALRMELAAAGEDLKELREIAKVLIGECKAGNIQAIKELADRLDGKPTQMLEHSEGERPLRRLVREIVHVTETREQFEAKRDGKDLVVEYGEIKSVNGNGRGNGHEPA
jgi:HPt (histidine-containing phosphotransfer) domain-containing protein